MAPRLTAFDVNQYRLADQKNLAAGTLYPCKHQHLDAKRVLAPALTCQRITRPPSPTRYGHSGGTPMLAVFHHSGRPTMDEPVNWHEADGICTITLNRPQARNAVNRATAEALRAAYLRFDAAEHLKVAIVTGAGGQFCAGADLKAADQPEHAMRTETLSSGPLGPTHLQLSKPLIAAIEGYALAGGLEIALQADLRVAGEGAALGVFCRRWGVPLIDGGTVRLPRIVGMGRAGHDPDRPRSRRRRSTGHGHGQPRRADRRSAEHGADAGPADRRLPASLHADRPRLSLRAVGHAAGCGAGE